MSKRIMPALRRRVDYLRGKWSEVRRQKPRTMAIVS
jgi:hypothetical protein